MEKVAVIDLSTILLSNNDKSTTDTNLCWDETAKKLVNSFHKIGFVYFINHGISQDKIQRAFMESKRFFEQPLHEKRIYQFENSPKGYHGHGQGYLISSDSANGEGNLFELRESFDFTGKVKKLSNDTTDFHESLLSLQGECKVLIKAIFKLLAIGLEVADSEYFTSRSSWLDDNEVPSFKTFRSLYYPAIPQSLSIPKSHSRVKEHSDFDFITLLFQDSTGGLEAKTTNGEWIPVDPIPGSLIVNIGDLLEVWTGGYFPATKHRVIIPETEIKKRISRQSIAYFLHPDSTTVVSPIPSKILGEYSFKEFKAFEHTKAKLSGVKSY